MKFFYYTILDGVDLLFKFGALVYTRVEKPPLGPVLAGKTACEGVFSDAKGRLFTNFPENKEAGKEADKSKADLSEAALEAICAEILASGKSINYPQKSWGGLAIGESCSQEDAEDGRVKLLPWYYIETDPSTGRITRVS